MDAHASGAGDAPISGSAEIEPAASVPPTSKPKPSRKAAVKPKAKVVDVGPVKVSGASGQKTSKPATKKAKTAVDGKKAADIEASRAPLMDHLIELRGRLLISVVAFAIGFVVCFAFANQIQIALIKPYQAAAAIHAAAAATGGHANPIELLAIMTGLKPYPPGSAAVVELIATAPLEQLFTKMKIAAFGAAVVTFPVVAWQLYRFVAPGLYRNERGAFLPFLIA
ncbi:hypothetical protein LTR94_030164, partial [Friedmanniomyces endolithicus]